MAKIRCVGRQMPDATSAWDARVRMGLGSEQCERGTVARRSFLARHPWSLTLGNSGSGWVTLRPGFL